MSQVTGIANEHAVVSIFDADVAGDFQFFSRGPIVSSDTYSAVLVEVHRSPAASAVCTGADPEDVLAQTVFKALDVAGFSSVAVAYAQTRPVAGGHLEPRVGGSDPETVTAAADLESVIRSQRSDADVAGRCHVHDRCVVGLIVRPAWVRAVGEPTAGQLPAPLSPTVSVDGHTIPRQGRCCSRRWDHFQR